MRKWFLTLAGLLLLAATANAENVTRADQLFNTGPFLCDGHYVTQEWTNSGPPMLLHGARVWHGRDYAVLADFHTEVRLANGSIVAIFQQDAYDMGGHREQDTWYGGDQVLGTGQTLYFVSVCNGFGNKAKHGGHGHSTVLFFWTVK